jgi:S1-C subfamily serine protease
MKFRVFIIISSILSLISGCHSLQQNTKEDNSTNRVLLGAPLEIDSAGRASEAAQNGVARIICRSTTYGGTGFLHKSGFLITAAHVVNGCDTKNLVVISGSGQAVGVSSVSADNEKDLSILKPTTAFEGKPIDIDINFVPKLGEQVATWGYPGGYSGLTPLLSVGYFSGIQNFIGGQHSTNSIKRWVINAAFNGGNSGGPLMSVESGKVIGIVSSKYAPLPKHIADIIEFLKNDGSGMHSGARLHGKDLSQAQLAGYVLEYLRTQVQLVIGYSVTMEDLVDFLKSKDIDP